MYLFLTDKLSTHAKDPRISRVRLGFASGCGGNELFALDRVDSNLKCDGNATKFKAFLPLDQLFGVIYIYSIFEVPYI
jgi:hypothetical protein